MGWKSWLVPTLFSFCKKPSVCLPAFCHFFRPFIRFLNSSHYIELVPFSKRVMFPPWSHEVSMVKAELPWWITSPQETMEEPHGKTFPWWLNHWNICASQIGFHFPKNRWTSRWLCQLYFCKLQALQATKATKLLTSAPRFTLLETNSSHLKTWNKRKVVNSKHQFTAAKMLVSGRAATFCGYLLAPNFEDQIRMT